MASALVGGTLLTVGLRRRSPVGAAIALAGGWLLYREFGPRRSRPDGATSGSERRATGEETPGGATQFEKTVTVGESADELDRFWRDPDLLSEIAGGFAEVAPAGEDRHRWTLDAPMGRQPSWETEIVEDRPGELLRWKSVEGAAIPHEGTVRFRPAPADRGTEVTLTLRVDPPGGQYGQTVMEQVGVVPETLANEALSRFKSLAETGKIPTLEGNPSARGTGDLV